MPAPSDHSGSEPDPAGPAVAGHEAAARTQRIELDYPVSPRPRFGHGLPSHPELAALLAGGADRYRSHLQTILDVGDRLLAIPAHEEAPGQPFWRNGWLPGLDVASLYAFVASEQPATYLEVGSGTSTKVARRAVVDAGSSTRVVSIDPQPRAEVDALCDEVVRARLEDVDLAVFDQLQAGDVLFVDNSHRSFTNSDVTVFFLEVLPRLPPGVLVEIHDIFLPDDYIPDWNDRYYNEQYLLATYLLGGAMGLQVELPCWFVSITPDLRDPLWPLFSQIDIDERHGCSFWLRTTAR